MKKQCFSFICTKSNDKFKREGFLGCGVANGYVAIPPEHPFHGKYYDDDELYEHIKVHGGLTFGGPAKGCQTLLENSKIIGCNKDGKIRLSTIKKNDVFSYIPEDYYIFGFDTMHVGDNSKNWNKENVINETLSLLSQFEETMA